MTHTVKLFLETKLGVNCDPKVLNRFTKLENHSIYVVSSYYRLQFICDSNYLALSRMEFNFITRFPSLLGIFVLLEDKGVFEGFNFSIKEAIVCKQTNVRAWGEVLTYVININEEKPRQLISLYLLPSNRMYLLQKNGFRALFYATDHLFFGANF